MQQQGGQAGTAPSSGSLQGLHALQEVSKATFGPQHTFSELPATISLGTNGGSLLSVPATTSAQEAPRPPLEWPLSPGTCSLQRRLSSSQDCLTLCAAGALPLAFSPEPQAGRRGRDKASGQVRAPPGPWVGR